jgi:tetratricopeptide (TPR) repeat protein
MSYFLSPAAPRRAGIAVRALALPALAGRAVRRRPRAAAVVLALLALAGAAAGGYAYALRQWHAAEAAVKDGRLEEAQRSLDLCLLVWPRSARVHLLAARAARLKGDFETAEAHLNRCMKLEHGATDPIQIEFLLMRVQRGEEDQVGDELIRYAENGHPQAPLILETLARAYMYNLRYGPAFDCLNRWIAVAPDSAEAYRWRGVVLERLNDRAGALKDFQRALELDPDLFPVRLRLAEIALERSNPPEALPHLEWLCRRYPDRPEVVARLGECRFLQGEPEEARRLMEAAADQLPNDSALLIALAKLEQQQKHPDRAEQWARRALKVDPTDTEAEYALVSILQAQGRWEEAASVVEQHRKDTATLKRAAEVLHQEAVHPSSDPATLSEIGALFLRPNPRVGLYWLHRALERDPRHQPTHRILAEYYEEQGDQEKAAFHRGHLRPVRKAASP